MNTNSNKYTFLFAIVMVIVVASALAFTATSLAEKQKINTNAEKMQSILHTIGIDSVMKDGKKVFLSRDLVEGSYNKYITKQLAVKADGSVDKSIDAFNVNLAQQLDLPADEQIYPLYVADVDGETYYIIPLRGFGLWDAIWGYMALKSDVNTVIGIIFDHKGETAGLGAEITKDWFQNSFVDEKILDDNGALVGISVVKGYNGGAKKDDHAVDAISGATLTGNGVTAMIHERLKHYVPYFEKHTDVNIHLASK